MKKKRKLGKLEVKGNRKDVINIAILVEVLPFIFMFMIAIFGLLLCYFDIKDEGMLINLSMWGINVNYIGSSIGSIVVILVVIFYIVRKPEISIHK